MGQGTEGEFWVKTASFTERHPEPEFKSLEDLNSKLPAGLLVWLCVGPQAQFSSGSSSPLSFLLGQHACCEERQRVYDTGKALPKSPSLLQSRDSPRQSPPPPPPPRSFSTTAASRPPKLPGLTTAVTSQRPQKVKWPEHSQEQPCPLLTLGSFPPGPRSTCA